MDEREDGGRNINSCRNTSAAERGGDERGGVREREGMWKCWEREGGLIMKSSGPLVKKPQRLPANRA